MKKAIGIVLIGTLLFGCATTNVTITTNVDGARVVADGTPLGETPIHSAKIRNTSGRSIQVVIQKEGYKTYRGILQTENNTPAQVAVILGYIFCGLLLPALLLINTQYTQRPVANQYFILEEAD